MRKKVEVVVSACDICEQETAGWALTKCERCGAEYCRSCDGVLPGCVHHPEVCKRCEQVVAGIVAAYGKQLAAIVRKRSRAIKETLK